MITLINAFFGQTIWLIAYLTLKFDTSLKSQFNFVKQTVVMSLTQAKNVPDNLTNALIQIEDRRFYRHRGIDVYSIFRAFIKNTTTDRLEGASTITQQLVRNITNERKIKLRRKIKEIIFAALIDKDFSKHEILFAYVNTYRFKNCIGVFVFCKLENYDLDNLSVSQATEIAARFKYPDLHKTNYIKYLKRVRTIEKKNVTQ